MCDFFSSHWWISTLNACRCLPLTLSCRLAYDLCYRIVWNYVNTGYLYLSPHSFLSQLALCVSHLYLCFNSGCLGDTCCRRPARRPSSRWGMRLPATWGCTTTAPACPTPPPHPSSPAWGVGARGEGGWRTCSAPCLWVSTTIFILCIIVKHSICRWKGVPRSTEFVECPINLLKCVIFN